MPQDAVFGAEAPKQPAKPGSIRHSVRGLPTSFEILNRQELGLKALHDLIERFDRQFPER